MKILTALTRQSCRLAFVAFFLGIAATPVAAREKARLLVLTDIGGDPDDQMSMVRLMTYANQIDVEGLIATHVAGRVNPDRIAVTDHGTPPLTRYKREIIDVQK